MKICFSSSRSGPARTIIGDRAFGSLASGFHGALAETPRGLSGKTPMAVAVLIDRYGEALALRRTTMADALEGPVLGSGLNAAAL
jgi:hypothetical protein